jgi:hypothetical protein
MTPALSYQVMDYLIVCPLCGGPMIPGERHEHRSGVQDTQRVEQVEREGHYSLLQHRIATFSPPAAGVDAIAVVPANVRWEVQNLGAILTTDAVAANRVVHMIVDDGQGHQVYNFSASVNQIATQVVQYSAGVAVVAATFDSATMLVLPYPLHLSQGWRVGFKTTALDAGDQWSGFAILVHEWLSF